MTMDEIVETFSCETCHDNIGKELTGRWIHLRTNRFECKIGWQARQTYAWPDRKV